LKYNLLVCFFIKSVLNIFLFDQKTKLIFFSETKLKEKTSFVFSFRQKSEN